MATADELVRYAYTLRRDGDAAAALNAYRAACEAFGAQDQGRAHCLRHIGDLARELGHQDEARTAIHEAERLYRTTVDDTLALANTLRLRALLDDDKTAWSEARTLYQRVADEKGLDLAPALAQCDAHLGQR
jgi:tetratricopeptide (TPR) repeat protein